MCVRVVALVVAAVVIVGIATLLYAAVHAVSVVVGIGAARVVVGVGGCCS